MESEKIAKRALKISLCSLFALLLLGLILIYICLNQVSAIAQMSKKIEVLELEIRNSKK